MSKRMPILYQDVERYTADQLEHRWEDARERPSCKRGCYACCKLPVVISFAEAHQLVSQLYRRERSRSYLYGLVPRLMEDVELLFEGLKTEDPQGLWVSRKRYCAFLDDESKDCSVYQHRPINCRVYHVFSPAELCYEAVGGTKVAMTTAVVGWMTHNNKEFSWRLTYECEQLAGHVIVGPLQVMTLLALFYCEVGSDRFRRAIQGTPYASTRESWRLWHGMIE